MPPRIARCLIAVVVLANAAATALYSGAGPNDSATRAVGGNLRAALQTVADFLTLPIATPGITDVRDVVPLASLGLALLLAALASGASRSAGDEALGAGGTARRGLAGGAWIQTSAAIVAGLAVLSALFNSTLDISWGWIVRFVAGAAWAVLIARMFSPDMVRKTLTALLVVAVCCMALTIIDRAEREVTHFRWPIGPITTTAGLAAVWAALAGSWAVGSAFFRRLRWSTALLAVCALVAVYVLQQTGRRAPAIGLIAAAITAGALLFWSQYRSRALGVCIIGLFLLSAAAAGVWVNRQLSSTAREVSGSLDLRMAYWRLSADIVARHPLLGVGPDAFVPAMTNAVEPLRAEAPHFYHGNIDLYAHNEWIQAAVELGLPAAMAYLALPVGLILIGVRRLRAPAPNVANATSGSHAKNLRTVSFDSVTIVTLVAGLVAIVITDCASITLRTPMSPVWYWTLLGLLAATLPRLRPNAGRGGTPVVADTPRHERKPAARSAFSGVLHMLPRPAPAVVLLIAALACFAVAATDLTRAVAQTREERGPDDRFASRIYGDKTINARYDALLLAGRAAVQQRDSTALEAALVQARELYEMMPSLHDTPALYAQLLLLANRPTDARQVLEEALSPRHNPYERSANILYAQLREDDPVERLRCVQRALRSETLDVDLRRILDAVAAQPAARELLGRELPIARALANDSADLAAAGEGCPVELLRINAYLREQAGGMTEAIADQRSAADFYRRLEQQSSRSRRPSPAEIDAFFTLARLTYQADPADYAAACDAIVAAEYYLILAIAHEQVAYPRPEDGLVWGVLVPTEFPQWLRPVWRLSALLHLVAGRNAYIDARILSSLPPQQWTADNVQRELAALARQACQDLGRLPPENRPTNYGTLLELARRSDVAAPDGNKDGGLASPLNPGS